MEIDRAGNGDTTLRLNGEEVQDLLGAIALSMAAYGILQNFMTPAQKTLTLPALWILVRLGAGLSGETGGEPPAPVTGPGEEPARR